MKNSVGTAQSSKVSKPRPEMLYPLLFNPILQERIWGGRNLEKLYAKKLPPHVRIGESWEISDRDEAQSIVANGPLAGKSLHWLMQHHRRELLGDAIAPGGRFPLLVKILDAEERLSLQVHPPAEKAKLLRGEAKTEIWYIASAKENAELYVGLKKNITRHDFETKLRAGAVADCFHRVPVQAGDAMFLPSGRVHAIGAGLVIFEIQQNSDTTYRVFDWNRKDSTGQPRPLHVKESLECIDFQDFEPEPVRPDLEDCANVHIQTLVQDPLFSVELVKAETAPVHLNYDLRSPRVVAVIEGELRIDHPEQPVTLTAGHFSLVPAAVQTLKLQVTSPGRILLAEPGKG
jgi:mannose-6-phosphate isomerase